MSMSLGRLHGICMYEVYGSASTTTTLVEHKNYIFHYYHYFMAENVCDIRS